MIDHADFLPLVLARLASCAPGCGVVVKTYKGDRSVSVLRLGEDDFLVRERGFVQAEYHHVDMQSLKKLLRTLDKREFPRSNKLHLTALDERPQADERLAATICCGYSELTRLNQLLAEADAAITEADYGERVTLTCLVSPQLLAELAALEWLSLSIL